MPRALATLRFVLDRIGNATALPLTAYQMRIAMRWHHRARFLLAMLFGFVVFLIWLPGNPADIAAEYFVQMVKRAIQSTEALQNLAILAAIPIAPTLIAREREEKTLGMLFVAGYSASDIYWSKFLGVLLPVTYLLLIPFPLYALAYEIGIAEATAVMLRVPPVILIVAVITSISLLVSSFARRSGDAMLIVLGLAGAVFLLMRVPATGFAFELARTGAAFLRNLTTPNAQSVWIDRLTTAAILALVVIIASYGAIKRLPGLAYETAPAKKRRIRRGARPLLREPSLRYICITSSGLSAVLRSWNLGAIFALLLAFTAYHQPGIVVVVLLLLTYDVSISAARHVQGGCFLELLLMPMTDHVLARRLLIAYLYHVWAYIPALAISTIVILIPVFRVFVPDSNVSTLSFAQLSPALQILAVPVGLIVTLLASLSAVLASANAAFHERNPIVAALVGAATAVELTVLGPVTFSCLLVFTDDLVSVSTHAMALRYLFLCIPVHIAFIFWYFNRYLNGLRDALFETAAKKKANL